MKNIYILPTDKPSRLVIDTIENKLYYQPILHNKTVNVLTQNLYITSDEEIEDCWVLNTHTNEVYFLKSYYGIQPITKKIILTTDLNLIDDGVQEITNTFAEWFVENPTCEYVEVEKYGHTPEEPYGYWIIISKEEPKQENISFEPFDKEKASSITKEGQKLIKQMQSVMEQKDSKQEERMYSEEEVLELLLKSKIETSNLYYEDMKDWFEQNKKD